MATGRHCSQEVLPFAALVTVECTTVVVTTTFKAAVSLTGLNYHVYMVYSFAISALVLLPLAYLFHRKTHLPPLSFLVLGKIFVLALLGFAALYIGYIGIEYSSPTMASAMSNLTPASTFLLAILFRMEKLNLKSLSSQAKIIGTLVSITGALIMVLYKGPTVISLYSDEKPHLNSYPIHSAPAQSDWIIGGALQATSAIIVSVWFIYQAKLVKEYPAEFILVFFYNSFLFVLSVPVCIFSEPNLSAWKLQANIQLVSVLCSGILMSGFGTMVHTWGIHVKGPVYVALFKPFSIAVAAFFGVIFLGDNLYLGSVIGSLVISMGFYTVIWGKTKEEINYMLEDCEAESVSGDDVNAPLLKQSNV